MKINKKIIISVFVLLFILIFFQYFYFNNNEEVKNNRGDFTEIIINESLPQEKESNNIDNSINKNLILKKETQSIYDKNYKLEILGQVYDSYFKEGENLEDVMLRLDEERDDFNFKTSKHLSLGSFVEEINNIRGRGGKYWIYYINDKQAEVGISKYLLKEGDIISWRLE